MSTPEQKLRFQAASLLPFGPEISGDGSMVAYAAGGKVYVSQVDNPTPHMVIGAGKPWGWSPDHKRLFFHKF